MSNRCQVTGREPRSGKHVSFSHKRNPRWFKPNIQTKKYWLARASIGQKMLIEQIFKTIVEERWSEIIFSPELRFPLPGRERSWLGQVDSFFSNNSGIFSWLARQKSFHCRKI